MNEDDFGATQRFLARHAPGLAIVRKHLTPATLWSAITALAIAITWLLNAQHDILRLKESVSDLQKQRDEVQAGAEAEREVLHKIDTQLAVMSSKVDDIASEVDRQRQWRDRIEDVASSPPHARKRR